MLLLCCQHYIFPGEISYFINLPFTIIIVLNPLAGFEHMMIKNLKDKYTKVLDYVPRGRYKHITNIKMK